MDFRGTFKTSIWNILWDMSRHVIPNDMYLDHSIFKVIICYVLYGSVFCVTDCFSTLIDVFKRFLIIFVHKF